MNFHKNVVGLRLKPLKTTLFRCARTLNGPKDSKLFPRMTKQVTIAVS